jgi:hypothetical protein
MRRFAVSFVFGFVLTILFSATVYANGTYGIVTGTRVNVRSCAEINASNRIFQVDRGAMIELHGVSESGDFFRATVSGESDVYIAREFVRIIRTAGTITAPVIWVYDMPVEEGGTTFATLLYGETITVVSTYAGWYGIEWGGAVAFVEKSGVEIPGFAELPIARFPNASVGAIIETAKTYIGTRYLWGGTTPNGFDCSGFMFYIFGLHGIELNRSSRCQARMGTAVTRDELEPGDLVFFGSTSRINHAGMYIGGGQFIHSSSDATGGVRICSLNAAHMTFVTARRILD